MIHLFVGPTVPSAAVAELLPGANLLPPVKHGDLWRLDPAPGDVVAIVDGLFHQEIAIRHKEILDLLERGVRVCGASSMGALRAAELHPYGMLGIGTIYAMLASGEIDGDDEVSLVHTDASDGYQPLSEALVDIRLHCRQALEAGVVDEHDVAAIIAAARPLSYDERAYARVLADAAAHGLQPAARAAYLSFVKREGRNAKREDALALVRHLQSPAATDPPPEFELADTHWLHMWRSRRGSRDVEDRFVADRDVLDLCRIAARDYPSLHERVALEELGALHSEQLGLDIPDPDELIAEFREDKALQSDDDWTLWRAERRLRDEELEARLVRRARLRAVTEQQIDSKCLKQMANDYAVALGLWPEGDPPDEQLAQWLTARETNRLSSVEQVARVAVRTFRLYPNTASDGPFIAELKLSGAFARARAILVDRPPVPKALARADAVLDWCAMRWGVHAVGPLDVLDRGIGAPLHYAQGRSMTVPVVRRARDFYGRVAASGDYPLLSVGPAARAAADSVG